MGISWIDQTRCNACGWCEQICPQDVIRMSEEPPGAFIKYLRDCQSCFLCELECPQGAITVNPLRERRAILPW